MSGFVVDCSCVIAWLLDDEHSERADNLFQKVIDGKQIAAPPLLGYEVCNVLTMAFAKRKRISRESLERKLELFAKLPIEYDRGLESTLPERTVAIAIDTGLTVYDAAYLETAARLSLSLASLDEKLCASAKRIGVETL